jgi:hypothetical protein
MPKASNMARPSKRITTPMIDRDTDKRKVDRDADRNDHDADDRSPAR